MEKENINNNYKNMFVDSHHPMLVIDKISRAILAVNDLAVVCYGYTRNEFLKMTFDELISGENIRQHIESLQDESLPFMHTGIWKHKKNDGSIIEVEITYSKIVYNGNQAILVMVEEAAGDMKIIGTNNLLTSIIESMDSAVLSKTTEGIISSWNKAAEKTYGYVAEEVLGKPVSILIPPELGNELSFIKNKLEKGEIIKRYETIRLKKDGTRINVSLTISPVRDESGKITGATSIARDISQDKRLKYEYMLREKQILEAQQIGHLGYWELNVITRELEWSKELYKIYGLDPDVRKITYNDFLICIHPGDRNRVNDIIEKAGISLEPFQLDHRVVLQDGSMRYIHGEGEVVLDEERKPLKIRGIGQDITVRKRAEIRLETQFKVTHLLVESKSLYDAAQKILQIICEGTGWQIGELWLVDFDTNLLELERNWNIPGKPAEEFIKISRKCKFGPGVSLQGRVWEGGKSAWSNNIIEDQFFPRTALAVQLNLHTALAFPIRSKSKISGVIALYRDDSTEPDNELLNMLNSLGKQIGEFIDQKQVEPALHESENLYKTLFEISPDAIVYTNLSGRIDYCNLQAAQLFGFSSVDEIIGQNLYAFIAPEDQKHAIENEHTIIKTGRTKNVEYSLIKRDRTKFIGAINTSIVFDSEKKPKAFIGIIRDITIRKPDK
jgi:PAS domain S-box-containing protein